LTRTPAFKAARRSLAGAVRQTLFQGGNDPELPDLTDGGPLAHGGVRRAGAD